VDLTESAGSRGAGSCVALADVEADMAGATGLSMVAVATVVAAAVVAAVEAVAEERRFIQLGTAERQSRNVVAKLLLKA
jgi:hypothetical protein